MSFKRLDAEDFVVSSDTISATLWSSSSPTLSTFFASIWREFFQRIFSHNYFL